MYYSISNNYYKLLGYIDRYWRGDVDNHKSTTGFVFYVENSALITWMSKKQPTVTISICEAEYLATPTSCVCSILLRNLWKKLGLPHEEPTKIFVDHNKSDCFCQEPNLPHTKVMKVADIFPKPLKREDSQDLRGLLEVTKSS